MSARDRITAEALKLFVRQGVDQTTTREIAAAAGIAEGTIYRHFKSKDELAETLFERNYLAFAGYLERAGSRGQMAGDKLARMLSWLVIAAERDGDLFAYLFLSDHGLAARVREDAVTPMTLLRDSIAAAAPGKNTELLLALVTGSLFGAVKARRAGRIASVLTEDVYKIVGAAMAIVGVSVGDKLPEAEPHPNLFQAPAVEEEAEDSEKGSFARHLVAPAAAELTE